jgi:hypothetical protein
VDEAFAEVRASFDRFCLTAGIEVLGTMMEADVTAACGPRHGRDAARRAHRWGRTRGRIGFHGGKIEVERPRARGVDGREITIPSWETAAQEDWLGRWAMNLMLINVSTRRFGRAVRLPEGDVPAPPGSGVSKSAASRRFVALSAARLADFMAADLSALDLLVVQIDGLHLGGDLVLVAAIGVDGEGNKHPLALVEGASENAATVQALLDNLVSRGLDPTMRTSKSSSAPIRRRSSSCCRSDGSSSAHSRGWDDAVGSPGIGRISIRKRSRSCVSRRSASC